MTTRTSRVWQATPDHHTPLEDAQGLFSGVLLVALGLVLLEHLGLVVGSTAGFALVISIATGWSFGLLFFLVNLPFYALAVRRMGAAFTIKTFLAVALLSVLAEVLPLVFEYGSVNRVFGAIAGGLLTGFGLLALFRHRASLGGAGILAFYCQDRFGWRAGLVQLAIDVFVFSIAALVLDPWSVVLSVASAVAMNLFLAVNHRTDRYIAR